jgi:cell division transport system permease protein
MALPRLFFAPSFRYRHNGWFFAILVGALVYLATFVASAELTLFASTLTWDRGLSSRFTVEILPAADESSSPQNERVHQALAVLRAMPDVNNAAPVPEEDTVRLLKPWISQPSLLKSLPLPALIDVERKPGSTLTGDDIQNQLKITLHDVKVDDHAAWLADLTHLVHVLVAIGGLMIFLTALTLIIAVSLLCRAIMAAEHETIELLHVMGAEDGDIANHFQFHARLLAVPGSFVGFVLALLSAGLLIFFLRATGEGGLLPLFHWFDFAVLLVPVIAIWMAALSARLSVINFLYTIP